MLAQQEAQRFNHEYIGTEHLLLGLVKEGSGVAAHVLKSLGIDLRKVRLEVEKLTKAGPEMVSFGKLPQTPRAKKVIEYAMEEARGLQHSYVGTEHLLLGLLRESEGVAAQVLTAFGLTADALRADVLTMLGISNAVAEFAGKKLKECWDAASIQGDGESDEVFPLTTDEKVHIIADRATDFTRDQLEKAGIKRNVHVLIIPVGYSVEVRAPSALKQETSGARAQ